jgi:hypothetical protein
MPRLEMRKSLLVIIATLREPFHGWTVLKGEHNERALNFGKK